MVDLVFDTSPLSYFARADHIETLERLTAEDVRYLTRAVSAELADGLYQHPRLSAVINVPWLRVVSGDQPHELDLFAEYARRLGTRGRNLGEVATLAWAEAHKATAVLDDRAARKLAKERKVALRGSVGLVRHGVSGGLVTVTEGRRILEDLRAAGAWLPPEHEYDEWARSRGLL